MGSPPAREDPFGGAPLCLDPLRVRIHAAQPLSSRRGYRAVTSLVSPASLLGAVRAAGPSELGSCYRINPSGQKPEVYWRFEVHSPWDLPQACSRRTSRPSHEAHVPAATYSAVQGHSVFVVPERHPLANSALKPSCSSRLLPASMPWLSAAPARYLSP